MLIPNFYATQTLGLPSKITLVDTSTGSDVAITSREILLTLFDGSLLTPAVSWTPSLSIKTLDYLTEDTALQITVIWKDVNGATLYSKTELYVFTMYNETFDYSLTSSQASTPLIVNDSNYYLNRIKLRTEIDNAKTAVSIGGSISNAQYSCDRATYLSSNPNLFF